MRRSDKNIELRTVPPGLTQRSAGSTTGLEGKGGLGEFLCVLGVLLLVLLLSVPGFGLVEELPGPVRSDGPPLLRLAQLEDAEGHEGAGGDGAGDAGDNESDEGPSTISGPESPETGGEGLPPGVTPATAAAENRPDPVEHERPGVVKTPSYHPKEPPIRADPSVINRLPGARNQDHEPPGLRNGGGSEDDHFKGDSGDAETE